MIHNFNSITNFYDLGDFLDIIKPNFDFNLK